LSFGRLFSFQEINTFRYIVRAGQRQRALSPAGYRSSLVSPDTLTTTTLSTHVITTKLAWSLAKLKQTRSLGAVVEPLKKEKDTADAVVWKAAIDSAPAMTAPLRPLRLVS
jgi:hypothetical protein